MTDRKHDASSDGPTALGAAMLDEMVGGTGAGGGDAEIGAPALPDDSEKKLPGKRTPPTVTLKRGMT